MSDVERASGMLAPPFADRLVTRIRKFDTTVILGLDPSPHLLPEELQAGLRQAASSDFLQKAADALEEFNKCIIDATADVVVAVKPQSAFYERLGPAGLGALLSTIQYAKSKDLFVILDAKRSDIATTAQAYADAYLGAVAVDNMHERLPVFDVDAITVNPYLGSDGIRPFIDAAVRYGKGIFVLVRTSNPSSSELQTLLSTDAQGVTQTLAEHVAVSVNKLGLDSVGDSGFSPVGAVVGATHEQEARNLRRLMPSSLFLVPGFGAQGGTAEAIRAFVTPDGGGALPTASRSLMYAFREERWRGLSYSEAARRAAEMFRDAVRRESSSR